ncbi:menaquinone-dependent protoporphyrinogen IX dehydrogenase [Ferrimonas balearica]|uniref:menaquinone-dependent protoporphyrinogen IX dehydrogenase n=1 Tax=Ferrimonas balearica TaxID=44012 RepID=UPI001C97B90D|nr:menaquinone-dependent protoporphyrinogen IX dehydrogenase [Ferrimonas balearica]MBY6226504.1 menaquinone-dependent protoporphyrinogen IX dehydrogenase [Ferrimonas balearica]
MTRVLILYSTVDGQTRRIAQRIEAQLQALGQQVTLADLSDGAALLPQADKVVLGASIRYGKFRPELMAFIEANLAALSERPSAFYSVNLVARKANKNTPQTNPYMLKFVARSPWQPTLLGVFAGKLNYPIYAFWDRQVIRFIMWMTKGPTAADAVVEYTDWEEVERFAGRVAAL